jgi:hypothetical protein
VPGERRFDAPTPDALIRPLKKVGHGAPAPPKQGAEDHAAWSGRGRFYEEGSIRRVMKDGSGEEIERGKREH